MEVLVEVLKVFAKGAAGDTYNQAQQRFKELLRDNLPACVDNFVNILGTSVPSDDREAEAVAKTAGIFLRQSLMKQLDDPDLLAPAENLFWDGVQTALSPQARFEVSEKLLQVVEKSDSGACRNSAIQCIDVCGKILEKDLEGQNQQYWPSLIPTLGRMIASNDENKKVDGLKVFNSLMDFEVKPVANWLKDHAGDTTQLVEMSLTSSNMKVQTQGVLFVLSMVKTMERKDWQKLEKTLPNILQIFTNLARNNQNDDVETILQEFCQVAVHPKQAPLFFKTHFKRMASMMIEMSNAIENVEEESRHLAHEFIVSMAETKPKMCLKAMNHFALLSLKSCFELMREVKDEDDWEVKMDDEEGDEDETSLSVGLQGVDRLVESLTAEETQQALIQLIREYINRDDWKYKFAALEAVRQSIEYIDNEQTVDEIAKLLLDYTTHDQKRVRYAAWQALSQMATDQQPHFQDRWHEKLMPQLGLSMSDPVLRVQQIALSFFIAFGEALDNTLMEQYASQMIENLVKLVQNCEHRGVKEEAITSIAVIAGVIEKDFDKYYGPILPILVDLYQKSTQTKHARLRGKAFECISLLGIAVGKEKFKQDAENVVQHMVEISKSLSADDILAEYIHEAIIRIARCLKKDFEALLPYVFPRIEQILTLQNLESGGANDKENEEEFQGLLHLGKSIKVKTKKFEEMLYVSKELFTYIEELEERFYNYVQPTCQILKPYVDNPDPRGVHYRAEDTREMAFQCWAQLVSSCVKSDDGGSNQLALMLLQNVAEGVFKFFAEYVQDKSEKHEDLDELKLNASGLAASLKAAEGKIFAPNDVNNMFKEPFALLNETIQRMDYAVEEMDEEDEDEEEENEEKEASMALADLVGSLMLSSPDSFLKVCGDDVVKVIQSRLEKARQLGKVSKNKQPGESEIALSRANLQLALNLACDMLEYVKDKSVVAWSGFMPTMIESVHHDDADIRRVAAFGISHAALIENFDNDGYTEQALQKLSMAVSGKTKFAKRHDDSSKEAIDNMVNALIKLALHRNVPDSVWDLIFTKLPLRDDVGEAEKVHAELLKLVKEQNPKVLGNNGQNLGKLVGVFSEVYNSESSNDELNENIRLVFSQIPQDVLERLQGDFSAKQVKKIQRVLKEISGN